jgi:hypothetical protein
MEIGVVKGATQGLDIHSLVGMWCLLPRSMAQPSGRTLDRPCRISRSDEVHMEEDSKAI